MRTLRLGQALFLRLFSSPLFFAVGTTLQICLHLGVCFYRAVFTGTNCCAACRFRAINGLLIPGGGAALQPGHPFFDTVTRLFNLALQANDHGSYFPILAVCLGLEALVTIVSQNFAILSR